MLALPLALALPGLAPAADKKEPPAPGPVARAFLDWTASVGLKDTIRFHQEEVRPDSYALTLNAGNIETVLGQERSETLYRRMLLKLASVSNLPAMTTQLRVVIRDGGYCDASIVQKTARFDQAGVTLKPELLRGRNGIMCSLDFDAVVQYQEATKAAGSAAERALMSPVDPSLSGEWSIDRLHILLAKKYEDRGAKVTLTAKTESWLSLVVRGLKREVIPTQAYWERLQVFIFLEKLANAARVRLVLDGKYGPGLSQPSELAYVDMEPTYTSQLNEYGKALAQVLSGKARP